MASSARIAYKHLLASAGWETVSSGDKGELLPLIWEAYSKQYRDIGMHIENPAQMSKYARWDVLRSPDGGVSAFFLSKVTPYGIKAGLSGFTDAQGRAAQKTRLATFFKVPGQFGEVSHKVEKIVLATGAPVVCANLVEGILGKPVVVQEDQVHYKRQLGGMGQVVKVLAGHPKGVPITDPEHPSCGLSAMVLRHMAADEDPSLDAAEHLSNLHGW